ncbi:IS1634 family transposase [Thermodesulfobium sp. 4217-1]|uniref:IS1634 family transposase n=1 Tax=Thermodesulfobium sp. 4217-1 TaxID=3120013 RepID=UPI003221B948
MSYRVEQLNKKTGVVYVYEATSYWDKEKKQPRNKQVCIGKIDPVTNEFIPSKRLSNTQAAALDKTVSATTKIVGPYMVLDLFTRELGLDKELKASFPNTYNEILSMAYYLTISQAPLSHIASFVKAFEHPSSKELTSQRISDILTQIGQSDKQAFFKSWINKTLNNDYLCYDITSVSSYSKLNEYVKYGYNRDKEKLPQINLAVLFAQKSKLPVYYKYLNGSISDVVTLHHLLKTFDYLELPKMHLVMDKGFYSQNNIEELLKKDKFIITIPNRLTWVRQIIDQIKDHIQKPQNYCKVEYEVLYTYTKIHSLGSNNNRCYVHIYYNAKKAANAIDNFTEELLGYKEELETSNLIKDHEEAYNAYFRLKQTKKGIKVDFNDEAIEKHIKNYAGFFVILTNDIKDPQEALRIYRNKDVVEKCFDDLKNQLDMKRLRIHNSTTMDGRLFVQFIALIYISALREKMRQTGLIDKYTPNELLLEMQTLVDIRYSGKYGHLLTEITKKQREILEALKINVEV